MCGEEEVVEILDVYIGYDPRQPVAYQVLSHSIISRSSRPVAIHPIRLSQLPITRRGLTEFTYSRFMVPWMSQYQGYSLFLDSDILCRTDISDLHAEALLENIFNSDGVPAEVWVAKNPIRLEWASVMLFDNEKCKVLTPELVQDPANALLDFKWAKRVGTLQPGWNHLVNYDKPNKEARLVHFTQGIPVWSETCKDEYAEEWIKECNQSLHTVGYKELMGNSVHDKYVRARNVSNTAI